MSILLSKYGNEMTTRPKGMNAATWACFQRARKIMKAEGVSFEVAYDRCRVDANGILIETDFMGEVEKIMVEKKCGRGSAVKIVMADNPKLHSDWLESQNK